MDNSLLVNRYEAASPVVPVCLSNSAFHELRADKRAGVVSQLPRGFPVPECRSLGACRQVPRRSSLSRSSRNRLSA